jgi:hypothetical protein
MAFHVVQEALCQFRIGRAMCLHILHDVLHREKFTLRWVPHFLDRNQKAGRMTLSQELLQVLKEDEEKDFRNVLKGDES